MTAIAPRETSDTRTSAAGSMNRSWLDAASAARLISTVLSGSATANTYIQGSVATTVARSFERTATGPTGQIEHVPAESTAEALMEIRLRSGLTWEELGDLFDVSRRSVHHWANGKPASAMHDRTIRKMLAAIRHLDQDSQVGTRALLLTVDQAAGVSVFDLLKDGRFEEAMVRGRGVRVPERQRIPLSRTARDARRPQAPTLLLEAEQGRPDIPAKARAARPKRVHKTAG